MSVMQIAERAGVSIATVSRVLNNSRRVQPQIIEQVRKAMEELNLPARHSKRRSRARSGQRSTGAIAILSLGQSYRDWFQMPVIGSVVAEITRVAENHDLSVRMAEMPDPTQLSSVIEQQEVDGAIVFIAAGFKTRSAELLKRHVPVVWTMGAQIAPVDIDHVCPDNLAIGYLAGEYLLGRGCRDLAFLTMNPTWTLSKLRSEGFIAAAREAGVTPTACIVSSDAGVISAFSATTCARPSLPEVIDELIARRPSGIFVPRDEEVVQVYRLLAERGVIPGRDVQIISCDNEDVRLSMLHPRPASIDLGAAEIARHSVRRLISRIKHPDEPPVRIMVNPTIVVAADETAAAATADVLNRSV
jgi:LacI family transcriptional regulator